MFFAKPFSLGKCIVYPEEILERKIKLVLGSLRRKRNINVSISKPKRSILEAILSRADRNFSSVIAKVFETNSCKVNDDWQIWQEAMLECGIDYTDYLEVKRNNFPWSFIGVNTSGCKKPENI